MSSLCEFVAGSDARAAITCELRSGPADTSILLDAVSASESSVYAALTDLERRGLIDHADDAWRLTGRGALVADFLEAENAIESVLATGDGYWRTHDPTALPPWARRELWALDGCEIIRAPDPDPSSVIREIAHRLRTADRLDVIAPVYHEQFSAAIEARDGPTRLILTKSLVEGLDDTAGSEIDLSGVELRVGSAEFALAVTGASTLLSLPLQDAGYDAESEVIAETEQAVGWGDRLFEEIWADADPISPA